ncbi:Nucleolar protein of 40 kDa [Taenia crassiceps]|uniref:Nucleolar protein of 40 kDa n=1 Tax=Taenia crassiceps TaxID=6207 RepID=A0ABR4QF47_9CEST
MEVDLYSVVRGEVVSIKEFGAFVSLEGTDRQGLLHRSAISNHPIDNVSDVLEIGEKIFVKIISNKDGKLGLSMKVVNQTTGEDRDPNNLITAEMKKRKQGAFRAQSPIRLGAELNTVCKRCGVKGHLASSCFAQTGGEFLGLVTSGSEEDDLKLSSSAFRKKLKKKKRYSKHHHLSEKRKRKERERGGISLDGATKKHKKSGHRGRHHRKHHE